MSTSEARILANRQNAALSTGPRTVAGKENSRRNSLKHGLTGAGIVLPNEDVAEVEHRFAAFREELDPTGEVGEALVRRAAVLSVRLDRCVSHETAALTQRIRQVDVDFVAPEGLDAQSIESRKAEARAIAMFDPSREATLARRYEAATERGFYQALKELRQLEKKKTTANPSASAESFQETLASFFHLEQEGDALEARYLEPAERTAAIARNRFESTGLSPVGSRVDVPMTIGRRR